tara:strand:- start:21723 stop:23222 length:1500 start_codon:yes stop_codon:yes gene_type:complete
MDRFTPKSVGFFFTIKGKVLLSLGFLAIYTIFLFVYSLAQKDVLLDKIKEIDTLQEAETVLLAADLAVFDAITNLLILIEPTQKEDVIEKAHEHFNILTEHYKKLSLLYPKRAPSFYVLIGSLAKVVMSPNTSDYIHVKINLENHQRELNGLILANQKARQKLFKSYKRISDTAVSRLVLLTLFALILMILISSLFFGKITLDIKRVLVQIQSIVARERQENLTTKRVDEIGMLIDGVNEMSDALDLREQQLYLERINSAYYDSSNAIEKLTAGLVHELGNPIAIIIGVIDEIEHGNDSLPLSLQEKILSIKEANDKLLLINTDLTKLASPINKDFEFLDFNEVVSHIANLLHYDERWYSVDIKLNLAPMLPAIFACDAQIRLLLNNLLTNSLEARISNEHQVEIDTLYVDENIHLIIKDNGVGMDDENLENAFTPFYTTKDQSIHSGMGLFSCITVVNSHKGRMNYSSYPNKGTQIRISFPILKVNNEQAVEEREYEH